MGIYLSDMDLAKNAVPGNWLPWWPVAVGLLALYGPTYYDLAHTLWNTEEGAHGPMVVGVALWLFWQQRRVILSGSQPRRLLGGAAFTLGVSIYAVGRSQSVIILELGSQILVLGGILLAACGWRSARVLAFPIFFLFFAAPPPGVLVDSLTAPLKQFISAAAAGLLYEVGYPVARDGVILAVGQYQLMVADACSGLHSLFSLSALGMLYVYLMAYRSRLHNWLLVASILPIAIVTNFIRVILLVLVTYHFGDAVAQGFVHGFAGLAMFVIALTVMFLLDGIFRWFILSRLKMPLR